MSSWRETISPQIDQLPLPQEITARQSRGAAAEVGGIPCGGCMGVQHKAVSGVERFVCSRDAHVQCAVENISGELRPASALDEMKHGTGWQIDDLGELFAVRGNKVQRSLSRGRLFAAFGDDTGISRNRRRVMSRNRQRSSRGQHRKPGRFSQVSATWEPCSQFRSSKEVRLTNQFLRRGEKE